MSMPRTPVAFAVLAAALLAAGCGGKDDPGRPGAAPGPAAADEYAAQREEMVKVLETGKVIRDRRVLDAMRVVPRHEFAPESERWHSYVSNIPLRISEGQTISAPDIVAIMTEALDLKGSEKVLEIGTGSGYQAAVLGELVPDVYTVEIRLTLAAQARETLESLRARGILHYKKIEVIAGDGYEGYKKAAPYDRIIVTAAPTQVPTELINQLKPGGKMVIPVGTFYQELQLISKGMDGTVLTENKIPVRFVPMIRPDEAR